MDKVVGLDQYISPEFIQIQGKYIWKLFVVMYF